MIGANGIRYFILDDDKMRIDVVERDANLYDGEGVKRDVQRELLGKELLALERYYLHMQPHMPMGERYKTIAASKGLDAYEVMILLDEAGWLEG